MDLVVDINGGVNVNSDAGAKRAKSCINTRLSPAFDSKFKPEKRCSSNESIYEVIADSSNEDSENEAFNSDCETDLLKNVNGKLSELETSDSINQNGSQDPLDSAEMDEMFVIVDDDCNDASDEKNDCKEEKSDAKRSSPDCENMDEILKEFSVEDEKEEIAPRLSDNKNGIKSAVEEHVATKTKSEDKSDTRVILSSDDDDAIDGLLDEFREEDSSDENSTLAKGNIDAGSATTSKKLESNTSGSDFKANDFSLLKSLPIDKDHPNNVITSSHSDSQKTCGGNISFENSVHRTSAIKNESSREITIVTDEKSNDSDNSSIEIIDDDDDDINTNNTDIKETSQNKSDDILKTTLPNLNSPASFSSSSEDKFEFDNSMILDIVDENTLEKENKSDNSHSDPKPVKFSLSGSSCNLLKPFSIDSDSIKEQSNVNNVNINENIDLKLQNGEELSSGKNVSSNNILSKNIPLSPSKSNSGNKEQLDISDQFLSCNGSISSNSTSNAEKDKLSNSETQGISNSIAITLPEATEQDNDELIGSNDLHASSKHAEDKNMNSQISLVDFPKELLIKKKSDDIQSLEIKSDTSCDVTSNEPLKMDCKCEDDGKVELEVKNDMEDEKKNDDTIIGVEKKTNRKHKSEDKIESELKSDTDNRKIDDSNIDLEDKKLGNKIELLLAFSSKQRYGQFIWTLHNSQKERDASRCRKRKRIPELNFWFREVKVRKTGKTKGRSDVYYYPNPLVRLRSLKDVKRYCIKEKIPFDPKQYDFFTKAKIRKMKKAVLKKKTKVTTACPSLYKNILRKFEETVYKIYEDHSLVAVCEKVDISRSYMQGVIFKIGDEVKVVSEIETKNSSPKHDMSTEDKIADFSEHENLNSELKPPEDSLKKRKLESNDDEVNVKKLKSENEDKENLKLLNGDINSMSSSDLTLADTKMEDTKIEDSMSGTDEFLTEVADAIDSFLMMFGKQNKRIKVTKDALDGLALCFCLPRYREEYKEALNTVKILEDKLQNMKDVSDKHQAKIGELRDYQRGVFSQCNFRAKVPTRTVGVNVKIYRESELKHALSLQNGTKPKVAGKNCVAPADASNMKKEKTILPKSELTGTADIKPTTTLPDNKTLVSATALKDTVISPVLSTQQVMKKPLLPRIITQANRPSLGSQVVVTVASRIPAPNVTVAGNRLISVGRPPSSSVVLVPSSTITSPSTNRFVDLKDEHKMQKVVATGIPSTVPTTTTKINVPGMAGNPNVLVPLKDYLQLLPPGSKGTAVIQQRPSLLPPLPSSLVGARTVTYIVPQNSALAGARGIQSFLPSQNQQVQFVLRVTNPGSAPTLSSVVNTVARPAIMQPPLATAPRLQPPMTTTTPQTVQQPQSVQQSPPRNSGLILISHTSKHPAPFPKSPHYPENKGKSIPPKPALKGSKNQSGIVLSWNMNLTNQNANISSYQLFAYQETDGPVDASLWKKVGDVNALPLPMACTLTQFVDKNRYYFTVRAVDVFQRFGPFSDPVSVLFEKDSESSKKGKGA